MHFHRNKLGSQPRRCKKCGRYLKPGWGLVEITAAAIVICAVIMAGWYMWNGF